MNKIFAAVNALKAGEALKDAATWKNRQSLMNIFIIILGTITQFANVDLPVADVNSIAYGLSILAVTVNLYFTTATSEKVGL
jgi:hypothetical protein